MSSDPQPNPRHAPPGVAGPHSAASVRAAQRDFEIAFFDAILRRGPGSLKMIRVHANNLARAGQHARALEFDRRHARLRPESPIPIYNIACMLARLGELDDALDALEQAIELGYPRMRHILRDPDLKPLRRDPRYSALIRRLVRGRGA